MNKMCMSIFIISLVIGTIGCDEKEEGESSDFDEGEPLLRAVTISQNEMRKSLPDVAYNSQDDSFFAVWPAVPGPESTITDNYIYGQKLSGSGDLIGDVVVIQTSADTLMMPRVLYNPDTNQYLVIYSHWDLQPNVRGVLVDENGDVVVGPFKVTDVDAGQYHYTMAYNTTRREFLITYNDSRNGAGDIYGVILDDQGAIAKEEFVINNTVGHQVNPVVCYNPQDDTYLVNWEDFRQHGDELAVMGTLEVMTNIMGVLLDGEGNPLVNDIAMCVDDDGENGDQRFNEIAYNSKKNEFLVNWTDARESLDNIGIVGRIVKADGTMPEGDFTVVDGPGAQMAGRPHYLLEHDMYFMSLEYDKKELDMFWFKDLTVELDIGAVWLNAKGRSSSPVIDITTEEGNQRFAHYSYNSKNDNFFIVWQHDFPEVSSTEFGHIMSNGGDIYGALYTRQVEPR
jgi:hypothetical protein